MVVHRVLFERHGEHSLPTPRYTCSRAQGLSPRGSLGNMTWQRPLRAKSSLCQEAHIRESLSRCQKDIDIVIRQRIPDRRLRPWAKRDGFCRGIWTVSRISFLTLASPPTSSQVMLGIDGAPIFILDSDLIAEREASKSLLQIGI